MRRDCQSLRLFYSNICLPLPYLSTKVDAARCGVGTIIVIPETMDNLRSNRGLFAGDIQIPLHHFLDQIGKRCCRGPAKLLISLSCIP